MKRKVSKVISLSLLSGIVLGGNAQVNAMIRRVGSNIAGAASRAVRSLNQNTSTEGMQNTSYSRANTQIRNNMRDTRLLNNLYENAEASTKVGLFKTHDGNFEPLRLLTQSNDEGVEYTVLKIEEGVGTAVATYDGQYYAPTLKYEQLEKFNNKNGGIVKIAYDKLGRGKNIVIIEGENGPIAYQTDLGIFRDLNNAEDGSMHLGHKIELSSLPPEVSRQAKLLIYKTFSEASPLKLEILEGYIAPDMPGNKEKEKKAVALPILTSREVREFKNRESGLVQSVLDKNGNEKEVVIVGGGDEKVAYGLSDGKFYSVGLSKKGKVKLEREIEKEKVSEGSINMLKSLLTEKLGESRGATLQLVTKREEIPEELKINVPKLTKEQVENIKKSDPNKLQQLKDANGLEVSVLIVGNEESGYAAYNPLNGTINKVRVSKKGNKIIEEEIDVNNLSDSLKNELENQFLSLNIGYTKVSASSTGPSQIVGGARRKTQLVRRTTTGQTSPDPLPPPEDFVQKGFILTKDANTETIDVYKGKTSDGVENNYVYKDGKRIKVAYAQENRYLYASILNKEQVEDYKKHRPDKVDEAKNSLGEKVPVSIVKVSDGRNLAYQLTEGIFRHVVKTKDGWKLKEKVDVTLLPEHDKNKALDLIVFVGSYFTE